MRLYPGPIPHSSQASDKCLTGSTSPPPPLHLCTIYSWIGILVLNYVCFSACLNTELTTAPSTVLPEASRSLRRTLTRSLTFLLRSSLPSLGISHLGDRITTASMPLATKLAFPVLSLRYQIGRRINLFIIIFTALTINMGMRGGCTTSHSSHFPEGKNFVTVANVMDLPKVPEIRYLMWITFLFILLQCETLFSIDRA